MKKLLLITFIALLYCSFLFSQDNNTNNKKGFQLFLSNHIGKDIVVYIFSNDITISGKLLEVYEDGIVVKPLFKELVFINKNTISFVEIKKPTAKDSPGKTND